MKQLNLHLFPILFCYLLIASNLNAQTITADVPTQGTACETNNVTLTANPTGGCATPDIAFQWYFNGSAVGTNSATFNIPSFALANVGLYTVEIDCGEAGAFVTADETANYTLNIELDPNLTILTADAICESPGTPTASAFAATSCSGCTYVWEFEDQGANTYQDPQTANSISIATPFATMVGASMNLSGTTLDLTVEATNSTFGCTWTATTTVDVVHPTFGSFALPASTPEGISPINLDGSITGLSAGASTSYVLNSGPGTISGTDYYPLSAGTADIDLTATLSGCSYTANSTMDVTSPASISFVNNTTASATTNWEACAGDNVSFIYSGLSGSGTPTHLVMSAQGGEYIVMELATCATPCGTLPVGSPGGLGGTQTTIGTVTANANLDPGQAGHDSGSGLVRFTIPNNAFTGPVCFFDGDPTSGGTSIGCINDPGILTVNNPETGFALVKNPMCYTDQAALIGIPEGGTFSALEASMNLTTPGSPVAATAYAPAAGTLITEPNPGEWYLHGDAITTNSATNDGGQMVEVTYTFTPYYTDNTTACPSPIVTSEEIPVFDNRNMAYSFPLVTYDSAGTPFDLTNTVTSVVPAPNNGATAPSAPPGVELWATINGDFAFSGTFVQENTPVYEFLMPQAGVGTHTILMEMDNNGCTVDGEGEINVLPEPEFVNLPSAMCRTAGLITFQRDPNYLKKTKKDTTVICVPNIITIPIIPIGFKPSSGTPPTYSLLNSGNPVKGGSITSSPTPPNIFVSDGDEALFAGVSGISPKFIFFTCSPVSVVDVEEFKYNSFSIWDGDPTSGTPTQLMSVGSGGGCSGASACVNNPDDPNTESFTFDPNDPLLAGLTEIYVVLELQTETTSCPVTGYSGTSEPFTGITTGTCSPPETNSILIIQQVQLFDQSNITIDTLPSFFCYDDATVNIGSTPAFETGFSDFFVRDIVTGDTTDLTQNILNVVALFDTNTTDHTYEVTYTFNKYFGCDSVGRDSFTIIAPQPVFFTGSTIGSQDRICVNAPEELLNASPVPTAGLGGVFTGTGIGFDNDGVPAPVNNIFAPTFADVGAHDITYTFTDLFGCVSELSRTINVRAQPIVSLSADEADNVYCASDTAAHLTGTPNTSLVPGTATYFGATIIGDSIFHPHLAYLIDSAAAGGGVEVYYSYTDTFGCNGIDTLELSVQPLPILSISGLDSRYCENAALVIGVTGVDATGIAIGSESFSGAGIIPSVSSYNYSPSQAGAGEDTVVYTRTNFYGCTDSVTQFVQIDTAPLPIINNLDIDYCVNEPQFLLDATPPATSGLSGTFSGFGVTNNSGNYLFSPQAAASSAGFTDIVITYTFVDGSNCTGVVKDTTLIRELPNSDFTLPPSYCADSPDDTLQWSITNNALATHVFYGDSITIDTLGLLSPQLAALNGFGLKEVTYVFTDTFGCRDSLTKSYVLHDLPIVSITGIDAGYCANDGAVQVQGFPAGTIGSEANFFTDYPGGVGGGFTVTNATAAIGSIDPSFSVSGATYMFKYEYTDANNCTNADSTYSQFFDPPNPMAITGLDSSYCETSDTFMIVGTPAFGTFSGPGTNANASTFRPSQAGSGTHTITYTKNDTNTIALTADTLYCTDAISQVVVVNPLPVPSIVTPTNNATFCEDEMLVDLEGTISNVGTFLDSLFTGPGVVFVLAPYDTFIPPFGMVTLNDTTWFFSPDSAGVGTHSVVFTATNTFGCTDSVINTYEILDVPEPQFSIDSVFCESDESVVLVGTPSPGIFIRDGDTLITNEFIPNWTFPTTLLDTTIHDTIIYVVSNAQCVGKDTQYVTVHPIPIISFQGFNDSTIADESCIGLDTLDLLPNLWGGSFSGSGVLFGTALFIPDIAGTGEHAITYDYTDPQTLCSNQYIDTIRVYSTPNVVLEAEGGCGDTSITFSVNNSELGLDGFFNGSLYDSITAVHWDFGDNTTLDPNALPNNEVSDEQHLYGTAGVYTTMLTVENMGFCSHTDSVRIVVSPKETPTASLPYLEDFNTSDGAWFDESEYGDFSSNLWEWAIATGSNINTTSDGHDYVWVTHANGAYGPNESGWVYGPCFDLRQLQRPMISLDLFNDTDEGNDGVVVEYQDLAGDWHPLGQVGRGINWYNEDVVAGRPGLQDLAPIGWSGESGAWLNARYKLDDYRNRENFRIRIAFGAVGVHGSGLEGFAFDDVWVGERSRNVILEHFSNVTYGSMSQINEHVYDLIYNTPIVKDVTLIQFHPDFPGYDEFNQANSSDPATRTLYYGLSEAGRSVIDGERFGSNAPLSGNLTAQDFEYDMLESPKFDIAINSFNIFGNTVSVDADIVANEDLATNEYIVHAIVVEDSLTYASAGSFGTLMSVMRAMLPEASGTSFQRSWLANDQVNLSISEPIGLGVFDPAHFELVVMVQNYNTKEIYQSKTTRDITIYPGYTGLDEVEEEIKAEVEEVQNMNLYPNPAGNYFNVEFDFPLSKDYQWRLFDVRGVTVQEGTALQGSEQFTVYSDNLAAGTYIFAMQTDKFIHQRKVIIRND